MGDTIGLQSALGAAGAVAGAKVGRAMHSALREDQFNKGKK